MSNAVNADFRCMLPAQRRKLMDSSIRTMRKHFDFDEDRYRAWEKEFEQLCIDHKTTLLEVVAILGIDEWFVPFSRGHDPFEAFSVYILNHTPLAAQRLREYEVWLRCLCCVGELYDGEPWVLEADEKRAFIDAFENGDEPWEVFLSMERVYEDEISLEGNTKSKP